MHTDQINATRRFVEKVHNHDATGHDMAHIHRVQTLAVHIAKDYPEANLFIIEMAALLHDTVDDKLKEHAITLEALKSFLSSIHVTQQDQDAIIYIISHISFRKRHEVSSLKSIEAKIVQDADRLDAIGAIGIARTFQFGGYFKEPMWTGHLTYEEMKEKEDYSDMPASAVKHAFEKLLKLKNLMNTPKGQRIAEERHHFVENFLKQFFNEWS
ncbi:HD domain-containing protein [Staphylococcus canis]|uniref:HD domain-containing protein n=1 Tax=Staphylococcus canis TaxID=2724942 RepID=A0ABS0T9U8_9STAP|nr:HD domain-containing protein [Staphylococcus canis]MBI5975504.1 HD domain-containing protein [Staphylococcus canis]